MTQTDFGTLTKQKTHYARVSIKNENLKIGGSHETIVFDTKLEIIGSKLKNRKNAAIPEDRFNQFSRWGNGDLLQLIAISKCRISDIPTLRR
jgi:hypothetical protein